MEENQQDIIIKDLSLATKPCVWYKLVLPDLDQMSPRMGHSFIPRGINKKSDDEETRVSLIGGGSHEGATAEIWELCLSSSSSSGVTKLPSIEGLKPKYEFLCVDMDSSKIWIFGGADAQLTFNDVGYIEDDGGWVESLVNSVGDEGLNTKSPSPRTQGGNSALVVVDGKSYLCVFAGGQAGVDAVSDGKLYLYDVEEQVWIVVPVKGDTPPPTQGHVLTAFGSKIYIHGGLNSSVLHATLYTIDVEGAVQNPPQPCPWISVPNDEEDMFPPGRAAHAIAKGDEEEKFYIFGGLGQSGALNDLWEFDGVSKLWKNLSGYSSNASSQLPEPGPRFGCAMTSIVVKGLKYLLVHGGMNSEGEIFNDLWVFKLNSDVRV